MSRKSRVVRASGWDVQYMLPFLPPFLPQPPPPNTHTHTEGKMFQVKAKGVTNNACCGVWNRLHGS